MLRYGTDGLVVEDPVLPRVTAGEVKDPALTTPVAETEPVLMLWLMMPLTMRLPALTAPVTDALPALTAPVVVRLPALTAPLVVMGPAPALIGAVTETLSFASVTWGNALELPPYTRLVIYPSSSFFSEDQERMAKPLLDSTRKAPKAAQPNPRATLAGLREGSVMKAARRKGPKLASNKSLTKKQMIAQAKGHILRKKCRC
jgi:hypothetical protein